MTNDQNDQNPNIRISALVLAISGTFARAQNRIGDDQRHPPFDCDRRERNQDCPSARIVPFRWAIRLPAALPASSNGIPCALSEDE